MVHSSSLVLAAHNVTILGSSGGDDQTVVVLGHGFGSDQSVWKYIVPRLLQSNYRVILYDLMGSGATNAAQEFRFKRYCCATTSSMAMHAYTDDLLAILDELRIDSCVYVGHSMSAMIGCLAAVERPQLFQKLVLLSASPRYLNDKSYYGGFEQKELDQMFEAMKCNYGAWVSGFAPRALGVADNMNSQAVTDFSRTLLSMRPDVALNVSMTIFQSDFRSILPQVGVPCHVIQSMKDLAVPIQVAEYLKSNLGGQTSIDILETEGHVPQLSSPEIVIPILLRCINS